MLEDSRISIASVTDEDATQVRNERHRNQWNQKDETHSCWEE